MQTCSHTSALSMALSFSTFMACIFFLIASMAELVLEKRGRSCRESELD